MKNIVVIGNGKLAIDCIRLLIEHQNACVNTILYNPNESTFSELVNNLSEKYSIEYQTIDKTFSDEDISLIEKTKPDIIFNIFSDIKFPKKVLSIPKLGAINFHNGPLPLYRGHGHVIPFWSIMNGEQTHGVTWHFMDEGIDTGDIIRVRKFDLDKKETALSLNFKCIVEGEKLFQEILDDLLKDKFQRIPQLGQASRYFSSYIPNNGYLDFRWSYQKIERFLRATDYRPFKNLFTYAKVKHLDQSFIVNNVALHNLGRHRYQYGEIISLSDQFIRVATKDSIIDLTETMCADDQEISIKKLISEYKIKKGDLLNDSTYEKMSIAS